YRALRQRGLPGAPPAPRRRRVRDRGARPARGGARPLHARLPAAQVPGARRGTRPRRAPRLTAHRDMDALRVLADDLTGACDVGAELLPGPGGVVVQPAFETRGPAPRGTICVRNTQSRTLGPADAARRVAAALADVGPGWAGLVLKKIDTGLRGPLGAEIDATMDALGVEEAFVLPAIPEVGRTTLAGRQMIGGVPVNETAFACDPHHPIHDASVLAALAATGRRQAAVIDIAAVRGDLTAAIERARAAGAGVLACDAETDADLERAVRTLLLRGRPLLLVGSTGLARALRRVLGTEQAGRALRPAGPAPLPGEGILVVAGSAHPATRRQLERAAGRGLVRPIEVPSLAGADWAGAQAARALDRRLRAGRDPGRGRSALPRARGAHRRHAGRRDARAPHPGRGGLRRPAGRAGVRRAARAPAARLEAPGRCRVPREDARRPRAPLPPA